MGGGVTVSLVFSFGLKPQYIVIQTVRDEWPDIRKDPFAENLAPQTLSSATTWQIAVSWSDGSREKYFQTGAGMSRSQTFLKKYESGYC